MTTQLTGIGPAELKALEKEQLRLRNACKAYNTLAAYASDWRVFERWCKASGCEALPASGLTLGLYFTHVLSTGRKLTTIRRYASGIRHAHIKAGLNAAFGPETWELLAGASRLRREQPKQAGSITVRQLRTICRRAASGAEALRDRAVLLFGFATALRRSNLANLDLADITSERRGLSVRVHREKQNREGPAREIAVPRGRNRLTCPVRAVERWLRLRGAEPGPLFLAIQKGIPRRGSRISPRRIGTIVRRAVGTLGLDPARFTAHSLRASFITEALDCGVGEVRVAHHSGHRRLDSLKRYYRPRDPFVGNACAMVGL